MGIRLALGDATCHPIMPDDEHTWYVSAVVGGAQRFLDPVSRDWMLEKVEALCRLTKARELGLWPCEGTFATSAEAITEAAAIIHRRFGDEFVIIPEPEDQPRLTLPPADPEVVEILETECADPRRNIPTCLRVQRAAGRVLMMRRAGVALDFRARPHLLFHEMDDLGARGFRFRRVRFRQHDGCAAFAAAFRLQPDDIHQEADLHTTVAAEAADLFAGRYGLRPVADIVCPTTGLVRPLLAGT